MLTNQTSTSEVSTLTTEPDTTARQWLSVVAVTVSAFAFVTTEFLPVGLLPYIARDLHVNAGTAGLMVTTPAMVAAIAAPTLLMSAGRLNRRIVFLLLTAMLLLSNVLSGSASSFGVMLLGRALRGAALGGFWTLATAAGARLVAKRDAARAMAVILTGVTCATVIGVPIGTFIAGFSSWRFSFLLTGVLVAAALIAQFVFLPSLPSTTGLRLSDFKALLRNTYARRSLLMVALVFGGHFAAYTYVTPFLIGRAGFDGSDITLMLLGFGIIGFVANFVASSLVARNLRSTAATMMLILIGALGLMPFLPHAMVALDIDVLAWGVAFGALPLCFSIWIQQASAKEPEAGSALFVSIIQMAIAGGSFIGGLIVDHTAVSGAFALGALMVLGGLVMLVRTGPTAINEQSR